MMRKWVLNCDIDNHKHGFVAEEHVAVRLFFQKSKSAKTPEVFLTEVKRHMPSDVKAGLAKTYEKDAKPGYRLRFAYDTQDGRVYVQTNGSSDAGRGGRSPTTVPIGLTASAPLGGDLPPLQRS